jgi:hypothetical protein
VPCSCRNLPHCSTCNASVRLPLNALEATSSVVAFLRRAERTERALPREQVARIAHGRTACPDCGETVEAMHERRCVSEALRSLGVGAAERERMLVRISFPE